MYRYSILVSLCVLAGCGVETVGTAAIVATEKKQEIEQAQQLKQSVQQQLDAAALAEQKKLQAVDAAANKQ
jgi:hypothetical protein